MFLNELQQVTEWLIAETERITRRHTPREVRPFRVYGQPTRSRVRWHVQRSSLPEEENKGDKRDSNEHNIYN